MLGARPAQVRRALRAHQGAARAEAVRRIDDHPLSRLDELLRGTGARPPGAKGVLPGWADDVKLEALRAEWFAATDDAARREIPAQIQQRAFEVVPFIPLGRATPAPCFAPT